MIRLSQLRGQRVLDRQSARLLGSVRRVLVDPARVSVTGAQLDGVIGDATILPWPAVLSIGPDAVMVESGDVLQEPSADMEDKLGRGVFDLQGKQVLTDQGDSLGQLEDVEFDEDSGRVTRLTVPGHSLPLQRFVAVGPDALIVPATR